MVKLTPELINQSMQYINPCRERELDLRGYKIPQIENLGATLDQFDTIDLSDNDLRKLDNLPHLPRLKCLLLNNNRILRISDGLEEVIPNLSSIILTGNNLQELSDLEALSGFKKLDTICLLINPVSTKPNYREYMAYKFPQLRLLDFRKIKQKDRQQALEFFRTKPGKDLLKEVTKKSKLSAAAALAAEATNGKAAADGGGRFANPEDMQRIREAIKRASSLAEVERLSQILQSGQLPEKFQHEMGQNGHNGTTASNPAVALEY
ncbi:probable U2 small nuclear ribonucleoprotein A' [Drosophila grimshawi]|uniref:Probable U2 small nuclear ribonucleoprotein A' n=1 Tax=Drosophila grimshawi TaxID=7222 RepID=B4J801_DROGR|nr:probable U2 small nuclear ribonucleoprotein A' [Drosophila grimshawi]XP_032590748.1 probable U2 small nuclear ribonucleoprotein A' [Drosophila grimshawi]EDW02231.1 GH20014 [Drosophila grimshawi]